MIMQTPRYHLSSRKSYICNIEITAHTYPRQRRQCGVINVLPKAKLSLSSIIIAVVWMIGPRTQYHWRGTYSPCHGGDSMQVLLSYERQEAVDAESDDNTPNIQLLTMLSAGHCKGAFISRQWDRHMGDKSACILSSTLCTQTCRIDDNANISLSY